MNPRRGRWAAVGVVVAAVLCAPEAAAQGSPILPSTRVITAGPMSLYPQIALRDAGTDSNVYVDSSNPRSDLTYSLIPRLYALMPIGNTRFVGTGRADLIYYETSEDQPALTALFERRSDGA